MPTLIHDCSLGDYGLGPDPVQIQLAKVERGGHGIRLSSAVKGLGLRREAGDGGVLRGEVVELDLAEKRRGRKVDDGAGELGSYWDLESNIANSDPHEWAWIHCPLRARYSGFCSVCFFIVRLTNCTSSEQDALVFDPHPRIICFFYA
ncbi:unnamed protein product [Prunus armeniaca]